MIGNRKFLSALMGVTVGIVEALIYVRPCEDFIPLSEMVLQMSGSRGEFSLGCTMVELIRLMLLLLPHFLAVLFWSGTIYRHYCTDSVYVFSRCPDRRKWYRQITVGTAWEVAIYEIAFLTAVYLTTRVRYRIVYTRGGFVLAGLHGLFGILWMMLWIYVINILSVLYGSSTAFAAAAGIQAVCVAALSIIGTLQRMQVSDRILEKLLWCDPVSHIVLGWHGSDLLSGELRNGRFSLSLLSSFVLLSMLCAAAVALGERVVIRHDLLAENAEERAI